MRRARPLLAATLLLTMFLTGCTARSTAPHPPAAPPDTRPLLVVAADLAERAAPLAERLGARVEVGDAAQAITTHRAQWGLVAITPAAPLPAGLTVQTAWADADTPTAVQDYLLPPREISQAAGSALPAGVTLVPYGQGQPASTLLPVDGVLPSPETIASGRYPWAHRLALVGSPPPAGVSLTDLALGVADRVHITAVGDYMLDRGVLNRVVKNGKDFTWPVALVKDRLQQADITFANLESPLGATGTALPDKGIWFRAPAASVQALTASGIDAVTVANNHILDYDRPNFLETLSILERAGIPYVGGGKTLAEARKPLVLTRKGVKIAFLGYSEFAPVFWDAKQPISFLATDTLPGIPPIQDDYLAADIAAARKQADVVIVTFHWGVEYENHPTVEQQRIAHLCIDAGAQAVLGYHPHAIQGAERYKDGVIVYSLGNFIMDQFDPVTLESVLVDLDVDKTGVKEVRFTPVMLSDFRPHIATGDEATRWWRKWATLREGRS